MITSLIDNIATDNCTAQHGLSLHITLTDGGSLLFDMGQDTTFLKNAAALGIDLSKVSLAIVSHGHYDHGGGLGEFLRINSHAKVYIRKSAFDAHYSQKDSGLKNIGIELPPYPERLVYTSDVEHINEHLILFGNKSDKYPGPSGCSRLFGPSKSERDDFIHEQNLIISDGGINTLIAGCAHAGIANIVVTAQELLGEPLDFVIAGMHLKDEPDTDSVKSLAETLLQISPAKYITMHCTGYENYEILKTIMKDRISYLMAGEILN